MVTDPKSEYKVLLNTIIEGIFEARTGVSFEPNIIRFCLLLVSAGITRRISTYSEGDLPVAMKVSLDSLFHEPDCR